MSWFFKSILLSLFILIPISSVANQWQLGIREYNFANCVEHLIVAENVDHTKNIRISVKTEDGGFGSFIAGDIIDRLRARLKNDFTTFELLSITNRNPIYEIHTRLIIVDSFDSLRYILQLQRQTTHDIHGLLQYYYIILINYQEGTNVIEKILEFCLQMSIVNVNLIVEDPKGTDTIYTFFPFTENSCRRATPIIYNRFEDGKLQWNRKVFPRKTKNLWLCPVKAVTWHKPPFVFLHEDQEVSGIDGNFLIFLSKSMNFTLDVFESPQGLGEVRSNGTMRGAFKILDDKESDLMVGGTICSKPRRAYLGCSRDYFMTSVQILIKKPSPYGSLEVLLFPFDSQTWCTFFMFLFMNLIARALCKKIARGFGGKGVLPMRLQIITWLLSFFIIRSSYEGSIFQFLHNQPMRRVPQDFEEALAEGYIFIAKSTYLPFIKHIPLLVDKLILTSVPLSKLFDEFDKFNGKYALINLDNYLTAIANDSSRYGQYVEVREPILHNIVCMYLQKFSFLTEEINRQIEMMVNHGHMEKVYEMSVTDKLRKFKGAHGSAVHTIPLNEITGAFELLFFAISVGFLILLMEIYAGKCVILKKVLDFFH
ncbi:uncharacterized protein LOC129950887 [Eupeodes corollae]|uniref:uncharacterized protein LOC129950887 n=1 Tax=Eupeodes corollae TaxID=290404 RepID=UPI002490B6AC|nr:uncharacterized protein LOC129950887 [Eupeodes corollae]